MKKIRVLHVLHTGYPSQSGYVIRTENILDNLTSSDIENDVICSVFSRRKSQIRLGTYFAYNDRKYFQLLTPSIINVFSLVNSLRLIRIPFRIAEIFINTIFALCKVNIFNYDIIHGHSSNRNALSAYLLAKIAKKPFVYDIHAFAIDAMDRKSFGYKLGFFMEKFLLKNANSIIVIDENLRKSILSKFTVLCPIHVAPNGIDSNFFKNRGKGMLRNQLIPGVNAKYLVGVDDSKPIEGFELLYRHLSLIEKKIPDLHFIVFGGKNHPSNTGNMTCLPLLPPPDMPAMYSELDLFILPRPKNDQTATITPLKILELMACSIPVLISDVGGLTHCIEDGVTGYVLKSYDIESIIDSLSYCLQDRKGDLIAAEARKWVEKSKSWDKTSRIYQSCYVEMLDY